MAEVTEDLMKFKPGARVTLGGSLALIVIDIGLYTKLVWCHRTHEGVAYQECYPAAALTVAERQDAG